MSLSYHGRRTVLEEGSASIGYRIVVTAENDRTVTVYIEDRNGEADQTTYEDYETAMTLWEARLHEALKNRIIAA